LPSAARTLRQARRFGSNVTGTLNSPTAGKIFPPARWTVSWRNPLQPGTLGTDCISPIWRDLPCLGDSLVSWRVHGPRRLIVASSQRANFRQAALASGLLSKEDFEEAIAAFRAATD